MILPIAAEALGTKHAKIASPFCQALVFPCFISIGERNTCRLAYTETGRCPEGLRGQCT
jgi:hypothetical protein